MTELADVDYFTDAEIAQDPYDYWEYLRSQGPVVREPHYGVVAVTGYQEVQAAFKDVDAFSAVNAIGGPFPPLPFTPEGDDISDLIEAHRHEFPIFEHMVVMDPPHHEKARSLLGRLLTPRRLQENEDYIWSLADRQLDEFIANGRCEFLSEYAKPFATLAIADLLGVPDDDRPSSAATSAPATRPITSVGSLDHDAGGQQPAAVPRRSVQRLHRRTPQRSTRRRADRAGLRDLSRRFDPAAARGRPARDVPLRRRTGDGDQAAQLGGAGPRRSAGTAGAAARRPHPDPGVHRRGAAHARARPRSTSGWPARPPRWAACPSRPAPC